MKQILIFLALGGMLAIMISSFMQMPPMGNPDNPSYNEVAHHYLERSLDETQAPNVIANIITDYRAIDTLGEATVLFTSIAAVLTVLSGKDKKPDGGGVHHG
ncbi:hydrogen gas-evolving membrane-bound hydrogenase subunit E [Anoxynatronum sibiricum]|uniref:Hydrogen gas-evolving membrane-bound hydrogenase subunit E n=1 Tax=Anoxynatronum sibiricum TaxID=210623 RepID=A0ABU9VPL1_9CLOT